MIAELFLILAGHTSSLFPSGYEIHSAFIPLLHPGERQCLESLGQIALRYQKIKAASERLARSPSRYLAALCSQLRVILKDEYEKLVVDTEQKVLQGDSSLVAAGSFVPLSSIRAIFAEWDAPFAALDSLLEELQQTRDWKAGPLIDLLLTRSQTGVHRVASIYARLSEAVQRTWMTQLMAYLIHGTITKTDPLASEGFVLLEETMPRCVSVQTRNSIAYVGRAIGTVKAAKWEKQFPRELILAHTEMLSNVLPQDQYEFDRVIAEIRLAVSEWLWLNVLTQKDVEEAVDSLANYFLLRNGEFALSVIRELERLKLARLTGRAGPSTMIREQDLHLALLRASLGTTAQQDPTLTRLRFNLPTGPLRPLLPSLVNPSTGRNISTSFSGASEPTSFGDLLLGTPLILNYTVSWPLDLFLHTTELQIYAALFSYLSALRKTHTRIHTCWTSLSNAQRARRRWTGLGEGGTVEDLEVRRELLRCGWGVVREMDWFLDTLLGYIMTDVVDVEFRRMKRLLFDNKQSQPLGRQTTGNARGSSGLPPSQSATSTASAPSSSPLDFSTLRSIHTTYLERLLTGSLLSNNALTSVIRGILEVCEQFVAHVERWGGDVLPALLFEGSIATSGERIGQMVEERQQIVAEINETFNTLLESFYEQLSLSTTQQPFSAATDASKSIVYNMSAATTAGVTGFQTFIRSKRGKRLEGDEEVRRHVERLLLRLDFNGEFSKNRVGRTTRRAGGEILKEVGLV
ncbi:gamma-tubulin ring complex protein [Panus rudis PR-1116 ss-1]|nr:gamma-tubulin ring complex protein [Panus rudis PR-1116 ss-1]